MTTHSAPRRVNALRAGTLVAAVTAAGVGCGQVHTGSFAATAACSPGFSTVSVGNNGPGNAILGLSIASDSDITGVGTRVDDHSISHTLVEHWNGSSWSYITSPDASNGNNLFTSVSRAQSGKLWAVGWATSSGIRTALVESASSGAGSWTIDSRVVQPSSTVNALYGVVQPAPNDVWIGGEYALNTSARTQPLLEHFDGSSWTQTVLPGLAQDAHIFGMAATGPDDVWAVGMQSSGGPNRSLVLHYDGHSWTSMTVPAAGQRNNILFGIGGTPGDMWAVGQYDGTDGLHPLLLHWNGSTWSQKGTNLPSNPGSRLRSVIVAAPDDAWAVGSWFNVPDENNQGLLLHWDGSSWTSLLIPNVPNAETGLFGVGEAPSGNLWAVGSRSGHNVSDLACPVFVFSDRVSNTKAAIDVGQSVVWHMSPANPGAVQLVDGSGLHLFRSPSLAPRSTFIYRYPGAGSYAVQGASGQDYGRVSVQPAAFPLSGTATTSFQLTWAVAKPPSGLVFDVEVKRPGSTSWQAWQTGVTKPSATFTPDAGTGIYAFRTRVRDASSGAATGWSTYRTIKAQ